MPRLYWIHGSGFTPDSFRDQLNAFPESQALTLPGHAGGELLPTVSELADWTAGQVRAANGKPAESKAVIAGNSLGGAIALEWALRNPSEVGGLILIGTGARLRVSPAIFEMLDAQWPGSIQTFVDYAVSPSASAELRSRVAQWHRLVGQRATRSDYAACDAWDAMDRVGEISAPTLIIVGESDTLTPPKFARFLHERIAGSRLLVVPGAGHIAMAERPDLVNPVIAEFLQTV